MTPEVNVDITRPADVHETVWHKQGYVVLDNVYPMAAALSRHADVRPASVSGIRPDGWRVPTGWVHHAGDYRMEQGGVYFDAAEVYGHGSEDWGRGYVEPFPFQTDIFEFPNPIVPDPGMMDRAITGALLKLKGKGPNIGVLIGERHETLRLFADSAQKIAQAYRAFRRNNPRDWQKVLAHDVAGTGKWPSAWLAVQYGIKPLVSDVQAAVQVCNDLARIRPPVITVKASVRSTEKTSREYGCPLYPRMLKMSVEDTAIRTGFCRLDYVQGSTAEATLASLGLTNPFLIAWELLPYSFVADWCINIGDYISTWDAAFGFDFKSGSYSEMVRTKRVGTVQPIDGWGSPSIPSGKHLTGEHRRFRRTVFNSSPLPRTPHFKDPVSYGHVANFVSLVTTALQRQWHKR